MPYNVYKGGDSISFLITAIIQQEDDWYVAKCSESNVASQGKTIDEALSNLKKAVELYYAE